MALKEIGTLENGTVIVFLDSQGANPSSLQIQNNSPKTVYVFFKLFTDANRTTIVCSPNQITNFALPAGLSPTQIEYYGSSSI